MTFRSSTLPNRSTRSRSKRTGERVGQSSLLLGTEHTPIEIISEVGVAPGCRHTVEEDCLCRDERLRHSVEVTGLIPV